MIRSYQKNKSKKIPFIDFVLLLSSKLIDIYKEIRDPFNLISSYYHYHNEIFEPEKSQKIIKKYKNLLYQLKRKKYIRKKSNINKCKFILGKNGKQYLKTKFPYLYFTKQNWDKKLRLVIFDFQEINRFKRNQLRRLLKQLGFIIIQKSVWLSPYNQFETIKRWIKENKLQEKILLIENDKLGLKTKTRLLINFGRYYQFLSL